MTINYVLIPVKVSSNWQHLLGSWPPFPIISSVISYLQEWIQYQSKQSLASLAQMPYSRGSDAVCVNATFRCTDPLPPCRSLLGFDFPSLWEITKNYHSKCHQGPWLVAFATIATIALTNKAAVAIAGAMYKRYTTGDIWYVSIGEYFCTAFSVST